MSTSLWKYWEWAAKSLRTPKGAEAARKCLDLLSGDSDDKLSPQEKSGLLTEFAGIGAFLIFSLHALKQPESKRRLLELFVWRTRGRPRKAPSSSLDIIRGQQIRTLWEVEVQAAWNMKASFERSAGEMLRTRLEKSEFKPDVIRAILMPRATPESVLARVYAGRQHVSFGRARNALRNFQKVEHWEPVAHV